MIRLEIIRLKILRIATLSLLLVLTGQAFSASDNLQQDISSSSLESGEEDMSMVKVTLVGLFPDAALLLIDNERHFVKKGKTIAGITLISTTKTTATLSIDGKRKTLKMGRETATDYVKPEKPVVQLARSKDGHYWVNGKINGHSVRMVLDTGATDVSISEAEAKRLGLKYKDGERLPYQTANGTVIGYRILLNSVSIQGITENNISASVVPSNHPILLGMSFLKRVDMREKGNLLFLERRY